MSAPQVISPLQDARNTVEKLKPQWQAALPEHISVEKFMRIVNTAIASNDDLLNADRNTLWSSCMKCAQDGLLPDGREAALVVYNTKTGPIVQYMPMITGILKKVRNSGELLSITSQIVFENDGFEYWVDEDGEHLKHRPELFNQRGKTIGAYALAKTKDGGVYVEFMSDDQLESVRKVSRAQNGPWAGPFADEMKRKTVLRRLSKRLPMSTDVEQLIRSVDEDFEFDPKESNRALTETKSKRLAGIVQGHIQANEPDPYDDAAIDFSGESDTAYDAAMAKD